jgi:CelD/BcsL family acetyltransferase involved in cellulose biosynthesis
MRAVRETLRDGCSGIASARGADPLALGDTGEIDAFHERVGAPITIRRPWLELWTDEVGAGWDTCVVRVHDGGELVAVAPLAHRRVAGMLQVMTQGGRDPEHSPITARSPEVERRVAERLAVGLARRSGPWSLWLPQLAAGSPLVATLTEQLPVVRVEPGPPRPTLAIGERDVHNYLTRNTTTSAARHRNRIARAGHVTRVRWHDDAGAILDRLPQILDVHRARDLDLRHASQLDVPTVRRLYEAQVHRHADAFEMLTFEIDDDLAAYALCLRWRHTLFVYDNRMNPAYKRFAPGLLANIETVRRAVEDRTVEVLDWGPGLQRYKSSNANRISETVNVSAWSSRPLRAALAGRRRVLATVDGWRTNRYGPCRTTR